MRGASDDWEALGGVDRERLVTFSRRRSRRLGPTMGTRQTRLDNQRRAGKLERAENGKTEEGEKARGGGR